MGYLVHIVLAVLALALPELGWRSPSVEPLGVLALLLVPIVLGRVLAHTVARGRFRGADVLARLLGVSPVASFALMIGACGWTETVQRWTGNTEPFLGWPQPGLALALAPYVVLQTLAIDARARALWSERAGRRWRAFQLRMFFAAFAPMGVYYVAALVIGAFPELRTRIEEIALYNALFATAMLVVLAAALPTLLRNTWETERVPDGPQRELLEAVAHRAQFRARELLVWRTGHTLANAAIVGLGARMRVVLFSDLLLAQLDARQLAAVFAHEMGHAVKRHVLVFALLATGYFLALDLVVSTWFADSAWLAGGFALTALAAGYFGFGWLSRRYELEADLYSLEVLGDTDALVEALEKVGGSFRDVASWRHFSTAKRVEFLRAIQTDPARARKLVKLLRGVSIGAGVLFVTALAFQGWNVARRAPGDFLRADLRLGHYASAAARTGEFDVLLAGLVERAREIGSDEVPVAELEQRARAALASGETERAWQWLMLGALREPAELGPVADAVRALAEDPRADVREMLGDAVWERWGSALEGLRGAPGH